MAYSIPPAIEARLSWRGRTIARTPANVAALLREIPEITGALELHPQRGVRVRGALPWQRDAHGEWNALDDAALQRRIAVRFGWSPAPATIRRGVDLFMRGGLR